MATAKDLAYNLSAPPSYGSTTYRQARSTPYTRGGAIQPSIPQFKGLYTYTPAAGSATSAHPVPKSFRVTMTYTRNRWPVAPGSQVTSSPS